MTNGNASLTRAQRHWTYSLATTASSNTLTVTDANGKVVYSGTGETASGNHQFSWNGKDNNGNQLADGTYKLTVSAKASDGSAVTSQVASAGTVSQIDMTSGTPQLMVGDMEIGLGDIANVGKRRELNVLNHMAPRSGVFNRERQRTKFKPAQGS